MVNRGVQKEAELQFQLRNVLEMILNSRSVEEIVADCREFIEQYNQL